MLFSEKNVMVFLTHDWVYELKNGDNEKAAAAKRDTHHIL